MTYAELTDRYPLLARRFSPGMWRIVDPGGRISEVLYAAVKTIEEIEREAESCLRELQSAGVESPPTPDGDSRQMPSGTSVAAHAGRVPKTERTRDTKD